MRIIEPHSFPRTKAKDYFRRPKTSLLILGGSLIVGLALWLWYFQHIDQRNFRHSQTDQTPAASPAKSEPKVQPEPEKPKQLKIFSSDEFRNLYNSFAYPGTREIVGPPAISGDASADARIRAIATARGYRLRSAPNIPLVVRGGFPMQEKIVAPWQELKAAAAKDGIILNIVSAFRSIEDQQRIFMSRLRERGATVDEVAAGEADADVDHVLKTSSIPGYSRHHTGYTLDLKCNNENFNFFATTKCFQWLSKNNYENAKRFGWIPSYPTGTTGQGPDPEAWEYVWVGLEAVTQ